MNSKTNAKAETKPAPAVIVFGTDQDGKPRAATFPSEQTKLAMKAAQLMNLQILSVVPALKDLAAHLPVGRIYSSGHGFVPSISAKAFEQLTELSNVAPATGLPTSWDDIKEGHLVIAREEATWFEAVVVSNENGMLTLKWRDYPKQANIIRHASAVALLNPSPTET